MKNRPVNEIRDFIFGNYYKAIGSTKEKSYYSMKRLKKELLFLANKLTKKMPDCRNAKEHYQLFIRKKNRKVVKCSKIILSYYRIWKSFVQIIQDYKNG